MRREIITSQMLKSWQIQETSQNIFKKSHDLTGRTFSRLASGSVHKPCFLSMTPHTSGARCLKTWPYCYMPAGSRSQEQSWELLLLGMAVSELTNCGSDGEPCKSISLNPSEMHLQLNFALAGPPKCLWPLQCYWAPGEVYQSGFIKEAERPWVT